MNRGVPMPPEPFLDVEGNGFTLTDDPPNRRTILTLTGSGGGLAPLNVFEVQGTSTVAAVPQTTYEVTATAGSPGNVSITTDAFLAALTGSTLEVIRCDAGGQTCTVAAPTGGTIQDPTTYAFGLDGEPEHAKPKRRMVHQWECPSTLLGASSR